MWVGGSSCHIPTTSMGHVPKQRIISAKMKDYGIQSLGLILTSILLTNPLDMIEDVKQELFVLFCLSQL
jgi:hypothetical protein